MGDASRRQCRFQPPGRDARRAPVSARNRLEAMRLYAEGAGDHVTVEGALHAWIDTDLSVQIDYADQWIAFGKIAAQGARAGGSG
ncbi:hypothetical protein [Sphingomonas oligophenolica]